MQAKGKTDEDLIEVLKYVHLSYLPNREGGLDTRKEWKDVLSGGEKQRVGRLGLLSYASLADPALGLIDGFGKTVLSSS